MQIGIVGLGKMGMGFALHLVESGYDVFGYNRSPEPAQELANHGGSAAKSLEELVSKIHPPRTILLSIPHDSIEEVLFGSLLKGGLANDLSPGDIIIDSVNAFYKNSMVHYKKLKEKEIYYLDMGVSGGPGGAREGASIMVGGDEGVYQQSEHLFKDLAAPEGFGYVGPSGSGHFAKMIHNAIEYGMMQAIAEGFTVLKNAPFAFDLKQIAHIYNHGAVTQSLLMGWLEKAVAAYGQELKEVSGSVAQTGEGKWTGETAKEMGISLPIIEGSVKFRSDSEKKPSFTGKILTALRNQFGGHPIKKS